MKRGQYRGTLALLLALAGCTAPAPSTAPSLGPSLAQVTFSDLPGWQTAPLAAAEAAFRRGCAILDAKPDTAAMSGAGYAGTVADWRAACAATAANPRDFFQSRFTPYRVAGPETGLFTGYYEPEIAASLTRGGIYQTPVYGLPSDLVRADLGAFIPKLAGEHIAGRLDGHALVPYATRAEIDAHGAPALVLLYAADPVALFFLQIQGSGRARLPDGRLLRLSYTGENGWPYTAIGRTLVEKGALTKEDVSLQSIRAWLVAHPDQAQAVMESDKSYVFLSQAGLGEPLLDGTGLGGTGTLGAALTPLGSLAVDARINALGAPFFVAAEGPDPVQALLIAQDTGGAIRGAVRGDIFFGAGAEAERRAGNLKAPGQLFVLLPNALAARLGPSWRAPP